MKVPIFGLETDNPILEVDIGEGYDLETEGVQLGAALQKLSRMGKTLFRARLTGVDCRDGQLRGQKFIGCHLLNVDFRGAVLDEADFTGSRIENGKFEQCSLSDARFSSATLIATAFDHANLSATAFFRSVLKDVSFRNAVLERAGFDGASCETVDLASVNLRDSSWSATGFQDTFFDKAAWGSTKLQDAPVQLDGFNFKSTMITAHVAVAGNLFSLSQIQNVTSREIIILGGLPLLKFVTAFRRLNQFLTELESRK